MADWVVVVDDDITNLKMAGHILSKHNKRVTAMKSGFMLLDLVKEHVPDIILLDVRMPDMDGFETLGKLRELEKELSIEEIPVIFLTADDDVNSENRGFEMGVSDYIRKPFDPQILIRRIDNILDKQEKIQHFQEEATIDKLTGLLNKAAVNERLTNLCSKTSGYFMMIDLDSFKLVNDLYGHEMGDRVLMAFADTIRGSLDEGSVIGRIGGDEFVAFSAKAQAESDVKHVTEQINTDFLRRAKELMGEDMQIPLGASVGAAYATGNGSEYTQIAKSADKALYQVKKNGKHGYAIYGADWDDEDDGELMNLKTLSTILAERNIPDAALQLDKDAFIYVYRFVERYLIRYHKNACKVLFTLSAIGEMSDEEFASNCEEFCNCVKESLRKSDLVMQYRKAQPFIFLTDIKEDAVPLVIENVIHKWESEHPAKLGVTFEYDFIQSEDLGHE